MKYFIIFQILIQIDGFTGESSCIVKWGQIFDIDKLAIIYQ